MAHSEANEKQEPKYRVHWKIGPVTGHGKPIEFSAAVAQKDEGNKKHGAGTHWVVHESIEADDVCAKWSP